MRRRALLGVSGEPPIVVHTLSIVGPSEVSGESAKFDFLYDGMAGESAATWSLISGSEYATLDTSTGMLTLLTGASSSQVNIMCEYEGLSDYRQVICTYTTGSTTETETETYIDEDTGDIVTVVTETTTNPDGSVEESISTTTVDGDGNTIGTSETEKSISVDGSYIGVTTNYDASGNPTTIQNTEGDVNGNVSTQDLKYDVSGNTVVTGYTIDTSGSEDGEKTFNQDGVNTEFYAFDVTQGFVLHMHFTIDFKNQPPGQNENHHNILTMKRATPEPWYGFQLRHSSTAENIILGTQFETGTNKNTTIQPTQSQSGLLNYEYDIEIVYDPTADSNNFICRELISDTLVLQTSQKFPDIPELQYLKVCIGFAMDENGDPYRYSNINVIDFSIVKLTHKPATPVITCTENVVNINCETTGATIYYRLNKTGSYGVFTSAFTINTDTIVQAYSTLSGETSDIVTQTCRYYNGVYEPTITCDGEMVTIACETMEADIYYRVGESGSFSLYTFPFEISATTKVYSYAKLESVESPTVSATCTYSPIILDNPVITCNGKRVTITCDTPNAVIHYRCNREGSFSDYVAPFPITADTLVEAYTTLNSKTGSIVTLNCTYDPSHDYSADYLTFNVLTGGTITWVLNGTGFSKTIEYSKSGGPWTSIIPTGGGTEISVVAGDIVRFRGTNTGYCSPSSKANYSAFGGSNSTKGTAYFDVEGNIMSLLYGDNFVNETTLLADATFQQLFKYTHVVSAEHLILPATTLRTDCYRAMFSWATDLVTPPELPAMTLATRCYYYMFEGTAITSAPDLLAPTLVTGAYLAMFTGCTSLNYIKCLATSISASECTKNWVAGVASSGTFVKSSNMSSWTRGTNGIPTKWVMQNDSAVVAPEIAYDGFSTVTISCETAGATIYYRLGGSGSYTQYTTALTINSDTLVETYATQNGNQSVTTSQMCIYVSDYPLDYSNRDLQYWTYNGQIIEPPYSVNAVDGHSSSYAKGTFNFETNFALRAPQPTYLWFQHADQSASVYIDNNLVEKHWGGYNAFFVDVSNYVHSGTNNVTVVLKNNEGNNLAPAAGDFNFNATLGYVKLFTSECLPDMSYGYDGMHISSDVSDSSATVYVRTTVPAGVDVTCYIDEGSEEGYNYSDTITSDGSEMTFTATIPNPHLWDGTIDPYMYNVTIEIYKDGEMYHNFWRSYGLRYYDYVYSSTTAVQGETYTGFLLNGHPYQLRGVCMHDDLDGKANALTYDDIYDEFNIIQELGCNFLRLAHYPHPKEVYDRCDELGIIVQTEVPCVNKMQTTMPSDYYTHLEGQYRDMVNQHYNHPSIMFWGLSNETTTDDKAFAKTKIESYTSLIKSIDQERWVGYVMSHSFANPSSYYNNPNVDWFGCNIYVGWYIDKALNDPTNQLNTRVNNIIKNLHKPMAFSEYGAGGTQHCHSEDPQATTTKGNYERHDIEYQMWLHEGHIVAIRNFPQLLFTGEWQLFDIAVSNRNEGYTECYDGETTSINDSLRRLNNKGLVERDHITKKDTFYIYKAEWNKDDLFVHICGKDYTKRTERVIKCYTNDAINGTTLDMYVNGTYKGTTLVVDNIAEFSADDYEEGDSIEVIGGSSSDSFTF